MGGITQVIWVRGFRELTRSLIYYAGLAVAMAVMGTTAIGYYLPVLLISGVITGAFTGFCGQFTYVRLAKSLQIKTI